MTEEPSISIPSAVSTTNHCAGTGGSSTTGIPGTTKRCRTWNSFIIGVLWSNPVGGWRLLTRRFFCSAQLPCSAKYSPARGGLAVEPR